MTKTREVRISISDGILQSTARDINEIKSHFANLTCIFKDKFLQLFPAEIHDFPTLNMILTLSDSFEKIRNCEGFEKHINNYNKKTLFSNYFVTLLASFLVPKVTKLILEPNLKSSLAHPDIYIELQKENAYLECKLINTSQFDYYEEHRHIFDLLSEYIHFPHEVTFTYKIPLSDSRIKELAVKIAEKGLLVTCQGTIINEKDVDVYITRRETSNKCFTLILGGTMVDVPSNRRHPNHIFMENGLTIAINGPTVDSSKVLIKKLHDSRRQLDSGNPSILVIDANSLLGGLSENVRTLTNAFKPNINTRFSAILLVAYGTTVNQNYISFNLVTNPFACHPLPRNIQALFKDCNIRLR